MYEGIMYGVMRIGDIRYTGNGYGLGSFLCNNGKKGLLLIIIHGDSKGRNRPPRNFECGFQNL